jgi:hypothetical protein
MYAKSAIIDIKLALEQLKDPNTQPHQDEINEESLL